jgi:TatD DNase family protein
MLRSGNACPVIFHWFSGSKGQLKSLLDQGHRISFNTSMPVTAKWGELIRYVPRSAILTETDGPFVKVGSRPAAPGDVKAVISWLSEIWKLSVFDAERQISENFKRLLADLGHASTDRP